MSDEIKKSKGRPKKEKDYNSPFAERLRTLAGDKSNQEIADGIGVARQTVGQFMLGNTKPDIETLCKLADYFNVSTDYLLCKSDIKTANTDLKAICEYTGLSEESIDVLAIIKSNIDGQNYLINIINLILKETNLLNLLNAYLLGEDKANRLFDDSQIGFIEYNCLTLRVEDIRKIIQIEIQEELSRIRSEITKTK